MVLSSIQVAAVAALLTSICLRARPVRGDIGLLLVFCQFLGLASYLYSYGHSYLAAIGQAIYFMATYSIFALLATAAYRTSPWHPLASFPGPFLNKISGLSMAYICFTGKRHLIVDGWHRKYGTIVRTGPNTLSINSLEAVPTIYTQSICFDKSNAYLLGREKSAGLFFMPDREEHNRRRMIWSAAFTPSAISSYQGALERRVKALANCIEERAGLDVEAGSVDITLCFQHWSYDLMGDVVFGGSSNMELMTHGDPDEYVKCGQLATACFEVLGEVPWLFDILWYLPPTQNVHALERLAAKMMKARRENPQSSNQQDVAGHLLAETKSQKPLLTDGELVVDSLFAIQAGSDSSASVMSFIVFFLLSHPDKLTKLRQELSNASPDKSTLSPRILGNLPYLNAVVDESLRLGTPFPGLPRIVPQGGLQIANWFIPPGTIVGVPAYSVQVAPENFQPDPLRFEPERWLPDSQSISRRAAIMCFSSGPFSCMGRNLALQELRTATAYLMMNFDFKFADDFNPGTFLDGVRGIRTTLFTHNLRVVATAR